MVYSNGTAKEAILKCTAEGGELLPDTHHAVLMDAIYHGEQYMQQHFDVLLQSNIKVNETDHWSAIARTCDFTATHSK